MQHKIGSWRMVKHIYTIKDDIYCWIHHPYLLGCFTPCTAPRQLGGLVYPNLFNVLFDNNIHGVVRLWRD